MRKPTSLQPEEVYCAIQSHCLAKEGAVEEYPWGEVAWKIGGKMFACGEAHGNRFTVKSTPEKQAALVQHPAIEIAGYVGRFGWVTLTIDDQDTLDIARDLIDESYESIRVKKRSKSQTKKT